METKHTPPTSAELARWKEHAATPGMDPTKAALLRTATARLIAEVESLAAALAAEREEKAMETKHQNEAPPPPTSAELEDWRGDAVFEFELGPSVAERLVAEVERLRAVLRWTHTTYCTEAWTDRGLHAPECLLYEIGE